MGSVATRQLSRISTLSVVRIRDKSLLLGWITPTEAYFGKSHGHHGPVAKYLLSLSETEQRSVEDRGTGPEMFEAKNVTIKNWMKKSRMEDTVMDSHSDTQQQRQKSMLDRVLREP